jgi:hypothetical protein
MTVPRRPCRHGRAAQLRAAGQATVEFAIVLPTFVLIFFAILQFALTTYYGQVLNNAAREGARYAIVHGADALCPSGPMPTLTLNPCDPGGNRVVQVVKRYAYGLVDIGPDFSVVPQWQPDNGRGSTVTVQVAYVVRPQIGIFNLPAYTISGNSTLVIHH